MGAPRLSSRLGPAARGARGSAGVGGWRRGAGRRPGMSSAVPPGVAGRLHQTPRGAAARAAGPRGAFRASRPPPARHGQVSSGRARAHASSRLGRGLLLPQPARPPARGLHTCASGPPAPRRPPLRVAPRSEARPDPGLAAHESARRSNSYETGSLRPFRRRRHHRLPLVAGAARATAAATTNGNAGLRETRPPLATGSAASQSWVAWLREAGTWRRRWPRRGGAGGRGGSRWLLAAPPVVPGSFARCGGRER